jgi:enamine deaminase RidA (YjgF/YER057c/UK114 family)
MTNRGPIIPEGFEGSYDRFHFAPAFRVGDTVYVSGVIGTGADGQVPSEPIDEFRAAFAQLAVTLEAAGVTLADVVELTSFHTDLTQIRDFMTAKDEAISESYPAWTAVGTTGLLMPGARAEVKATAVISAD